MSVGLRAVRYPGPRVKVVWGIEPDPSLCTHIVFGWLAARCRKRRRAACGRRACVPRTAVRGRVFDCKPRTPANHRSCGPTHPHIHTHTGAERRQGPRHGSVRVRGPAAGGGGGAAGPDDVCVERRRVAWPDAGAGCSVRWAQLAPYSWPCDGTAVPTTAARVAWATSAAPLCACWLLHLPFSPLLPPLPPFAWHSPLHSPPTTTPPLLPHPRPPQ